MSYVNTQGSSGARGWVRYVLQGKGEDGQCADRVGAYSSDLGDPEETVEQIEQIMAAHPSRRLQGRKIIQSFTLDDLDKDDPVDVARANALGMELARRIAPHSPAIVVTHIDAKSGNLHNHIYLVNHDFETGKSLRGPARTAFRLRKVNDQLMREEGLTVTREGDLGLDKMRAKSQLRGEDTLAQGKTVDDLTGGTWTEWCADQIDGAVQDPRVTDVDSLITVAAERGVSIRMKHSKKDAKAGRPPSMTYALVDENGAVRTHKKSTFACGQKRLGKDYSYTGLAESIAYTVAKRQNTKNTNTPLENTDHVPSNTIGGRDRPAAGSDLSTALAGLDSAVSAADRHAVIDQSLLESADRRGPGQARRDADDDDGGRGRAEEPDGRPAAGRDDAEAPGPDLDGVRVQIKRRRAELADAAERPRRDHAAAGRAVDDRRGAVSGSAGDAVAREADQAPEQGSRSRKRSLTAGQKAKLADRAFLKQQHEEAAKSTGLDYGD